MAVSIGYKRDRLIVSGIECDCPHEHAQPTLDIYVGAGLLAKLPQYIARRELGEKAVLVADETTYSAAGAAVERALVDAGIEVTLCVLRREGAVEPDEAAVGEALMAMRLDTEFFVGVGSGTVTDVTRTVAGQTERPFVCVATAPSMDGYTSTVAPLLRRGVKIHLPSICPEIIVCDLDVLCAAPLAMFQAGAGDVMGKYVAVCDWAISALITGEDYCPTCARMAAAAADKVLSHIDEIRGRTPEGARVLIEALLLSGLTVMIIGNTRAVASVEHNIVHYWEMQKLLAGERPAPHGLAVGVATLQVYPAYEQFAQIDPAAIDAQRALALCWDRPAREAFLREFYGERAAAEIMAENPQDFLTAAQLQRRVEAIKRNFDKIRAVIGRMPQRAQIEGALRALGAPTEPGQIGIGEALLRRSLACGKDYRARYTLFMAIDEIGMRYSPPKLENRA